jgi:tetratricopeptide (TPR) repeat protein
MMPPKPVRQSSAMARNNKSGRGKARRPARPTAGPLSEVKHLVARRQWAQADQRLDQLQAGRSRDPRWLAMRMEVAMHLGDTLKQQAACEDLLKLTPDDPDLLLLLAGLYLARVRPAFALRTLREFVARWPDHPEAARTRETLASVGAEHARQLENLGLAGPDATELAEWHEQVQLHLERGEYAAARELAERLHARRPQFAPAVNNATEAALRSGDPAAAADLARRVLAADPDNVYALGNLARALVFTSRTAEAGEVVAQLRALIPTRPDGWVKIAEALATLGDDEGVQAAADAGRAADLGPDEAALLEHLSGVAAYRQGREADARGHWKAALRIVPNHAAARAHLDDLGKPIDNRHAAWPFSITDWLPQELIQEMARRVGRKQGPALQQTVREFLAGHPFLAALVPALLDRGDEAGRTWALMLARMARTPPLLEALRDFALGPRGPYVQRMEAAEMAEDAGLIPPGPVTMWVKGERREVQPMHAEITDEPAHTHSKPVAKLALQAHEALYAGDGERAERLLRRALELEPDGPGLLNNLAMALDLQDRTDEAHALLRQIHRDHPDYLFATVGVARLELAADNVDAAWEMVKPLFARRKLHVSEFSALAMLQIELSLARGDRAGSKTWLEMWEQSVPGHPQLPAFRRRVRGGVFGRLWNR